jgi:type VII secretion protein EccE
VAIFGLIPARDRRRASGKALWDERNGCEERGAALARRVAAAAKDCRRPGELLNRLLWGVNPQREGGEYNDGEDGGRGVGGGRGVWWGGADAALGDDAGTLDGSGRESLQLAGASQAIAGAPMKAQRRLGLDLSWSRITPVFVIDVAVLLLVTRCWPDAWRHAVPAWWVGAAVAVVATLAGVITYRGITMASGLAAWLWDWSDDPATTLRAGCTPAIDHRRRFSRDVVGVREHQDRLVAVIAVNVAAGPPAGRHERQEVRPPILRVAAVAAGLRQFDTCLDGIDIVSVRTRHAAGDGDSSGERTADDQPARGQRSTWLVLRMDPQHNVAAMVARDSVASALAAATERLAGYLGDRHCAAQPLTGDELTEVDAAVLAGLQPTWSRPGWRYLKHFNGHATSFWVSPGDISSDTLDRLWLPDTDATVVTIRLTAAAGGAEVSAWVRYHSPGQLGKDVWAGLNRLTGRQLAAVRASLPTPVRRPLLVVPARALRDSEPLAVRLGSASVSPGLERSTSPADGQPMTGAPAYSSTH